MAFSKPGNRAEWERSNAEAARAQHAHLIFRMKEAPAYSPGRDEHVRRADLIDSCADAAPWAGEYFCTIDNAYLMLQPHADHATAKTLGESFVKEHRRCQRTCRPSRK